MSTKKKLSASLGDEKAVRKLYYHFSLSFWTLSSVILALANFIVCLEDN